MGLGPAPVVPAARTIKMMHGGLVSPVMLVLAVGGACAQDLVLDNPSFETDTDTQTYTYMTPTGWVAEGGVVVVCMTTAVDGPVHSTRAPPSVTSHIISGGRSSES